MRATGTRAWSLTAAVIALALGGSVGPAAAQARPTADSVAEEATKIVQSVQETAKGIGKTLTEGATEVETLEPSAHGFGESIWDGMKSVGRSVQKFFTRG